MSRYEFPGNDPAMSVVVGWDGPMHSYYAQVWPPGSDVDGSIPAVVSRGNTYNDLPDIKDLRAVVAPFAEIPFETGVDLVMDPDQPRYSDFGGLS